MDIALALSNEHTKALTLRIGKFIGKNPDRFAEIVKLMLGKDLLIAQRASWVLGTHAEKNPALIIPHLAKLLPLLSKPVHPALKRNIVRVLQHLEIPPKFESAVINQCFNLISNHDETIAVKAFSISIITNLSKKYPDLMQELKAWMDNHRAILSKAEIKRVEKAGLIKKQ